MIKAVFSHSILIPLFILVFAAVASHAQNLGGERDLYHEILKNIKKDIETKYYDPKFHGVDLDGITKQASGYISNAKSIEEMNDIVARYLYQFDDSHLFFSPPHNTTSVDYGWEIQMIGDKAFITDVKPDRDAWSKGIRPGDRLYMLEGFIPTRETFWVLKRHYEDLSPQLSLVAIIVKPSGNSYKVVIQAKVEKESVFRPSTRELKLDYERTYRKMTHQSFYDGVPGLCVWKMPSFEIGEISLDKMTNRLKKCSSLILDLRGNDGGFLATLAQLVENFFDHDVMIGTTKEREGDKKLIVEAKSQKSYSGKLAVLIDSGSASAAELFARVIQLEKRGTVIGDQSQGAVMGAVYITHTFGLDSLIPYGVSVTIADITMKDGQRLEKIGVQPDEKVLPTPADLLNDRDPALARAAAVLGFTLTPEAAGKIFPKKSGD